MLIQNTNNLAPPAVAGVASNIGGAPVARASAASEDQKQVAEKQPSAVQLQNEVGKINSALRQNNKNVELSFSTDQSTNKPIVKLMDKDTGDTLLQYPSEAVIAISRGIDEFQHGLLLRQKA